MTDLALSASRGEGVWLKVQQEWWRGGYAQGLYWGEDHLAPDARSNRRGYRRPIMETITMAGPAEVTTVDETVRVQRFLRQWVDWRNAVGASLALRRRNGTFRFPGDETVPAVAERFDTVAKWFPSRGAPVLRSDEALRHANFEDVG